MADELNTENTNNNNQIQYTPEQQTHIESLIGQRLARERSKWEGEKNTFQTQLDQLKQDLTDAKKGKPHSGGSGSGEGADQLHAQIAEMKLSAKDAVAEINRWKAEAQRLAGDLDKEKQHALEVQKESAILAAAGKHNFVDVNEVAALTKNSIQWNKDTGRFVVLGDNGSPRLNAAMEEMSLEQYYGTFAASKRHLVRGDVRPGTGSSESQRTVGTNLTKYELTQIFGPKSNSRLAMQLMNEDPQSYASMKRAAVEQGLLPRPR